MRSTLQTLLAALLLATPTVAQHEGHVRHASLYADQEDSGIAALSTSEVRQLEEGAGLGMARTAELNGYPGPKHVLEMSAELGLSAEQRTAVEAAHTEMRALAMHLGSEIVSHERRLQQRFVHRHIDESSLRQATAEIARLYGELRLAHLTAHLRTTALLTDEQIERYDELRGYR